MLICHSIIPINWQTSKCLLGCGTMLIIKRNHRRSLDGRDALKSRGVLLYCARPPTLARLEALLRRIKTLRRQNYGEGYKYDVWREIEVELEMIISDLLEN